MQEKLDVVHRLIADWTTAVVAEMGARAASIAAVNVDLDAKTHAAKANFAVIKKSYFKEKRLFCWT